MHSEIKLFLLPFKKSLSNSIQGNKINDYKIKNNITLTWEDVSSGSSHIAQRDEITARQRSSGTRFDITNDIKFGNVKARSLGKRRLSDSLK